MSKPYEKECIFCGKKIRMSDELGKWRPFNIEDNTEHDCKSKNGKKQEITLKAVLKKLESNGIIVNVDRLMSTK